MTDAGRAAPAGIIPKQILDDFEKLQAVTKGRSASVTSGDDCCPFLKVSAIRLAVQNIEESPLPDVKSFAGELYTLLATKRALPLQGGGIKHNTPWTEETLLTWLRGGRNNPKPDAMEGILNCAIDIVEGIFDERQRHGRPLAAAFSDWPSITECFQAIFGSITPPVAGVFRPHKLFKPFYGESFLSEKQAIDPEPLIQRAEQAYRHIRDLDGHRFVVINGTPHSGKKTLLRYFLDPLKDRHLALQNGDRLPVLALALDDQPINDFIDRVYRFYASASGLAWDQKRLLDGAAPQVKLERISQLAKSYPACVVIADVAPVDADPIVRALAQDQVGDVIAAIVAGDKRTRLLVTAPEYGAKFDHPSALLFKDFKAIAVDRDITISSARLASEGIKGWLPFDDNKKVRAITCTLSIVAIGLMNRKFGLRELRGHRRRLRIAVNHDSPEQITRHIWEDLLEPHERTVLGLIAASHDGLRLVTLRRIIQVLRKHIPDAWHPREPTDDNIRPCRQLSQHSTHTKAAAARNVLASLS